MKYQRRIIVSILWIVLGAALIGCSAFEVIDTFWSGMGGGLVAVGIMQTIKHIRYNTNEEYREKMEIERNDERNKFIGGRAWAWAGYFYVMINAVGTIAFKIMENDLLSQYCAYSVCIILVLYWLSFLFLRKKY